MSILASGAFKRVVVGLQADQSTKAAAGVGEIIPFKTADMNDAVVSWQSQNMYTSQQERSQHHGTKTADGSIDAELEPQVFQFLMGSILRGPWAAVSAYSAGTDVTAAATSPHFVDTSAGFLTAGLKVGMVGRWTGFSGGGATTNNARNFPITALTASDMTGIFLDGTSVVADAAGDAVTFTPVGKVCMIPPSGHTINWWTVGLEQLDLAEYEEFLGCVMSDMVLTYPNNGNVGIKFGVMGLSSEAPGAAYFTAPDNFSVGSPLNLTNGAVIFNGTKSVALQDATVTVTGQFTRAGGVAGSNAEPGIIPGQMKVSGSANLVYAINASMPEHALFTNKTEIPITIVASSSNSATAGFVSVFMSKCLINSWNRTGQKVAITFSAVENITTSANNDVTAITIQDSGAL